MSRFHHSLRRAKASLVDEHGIHKVGKDSSARAKICVELVCPGHNETVAVLSSDWPLRGLGCREQASSSAYSRAAVN